MKINSKIIKGVVITITRETERYVWLSIYENDNVSLEVQIDIQKERMVSFQIDEPSLEKLDIATLVLEESENIIKWLEE